MTGEGAGAPAGPAAARSVGPTVAWFHCFAGIAGDMALGSLIDAGADLAEVVGLLERLPFDGWHLDVEPVLRGGIAATRAVVTAEDSTVARTHADIVALLEAASLPERVAARARATFAVLAAVEGRLHRRPADQVHFHEVGGHDAIVDVVGTAAALEVLGVDEVRASGVATGTGTVRAAHGTLPNPAPAVVALLASVGAPTWGRDVDVELTTPTGAALLAALASGFGPLPPMEVRAQGFGAGSRDLEDLANCTQVVVGTAMPDAGGTDPGAGQPVVQLEATVDDVTGEHLALAVAQLLDAGAHDAWLSPVVMKKGRPGHVVCALCDPADVARVRAVLRSATGTLGVRALHGERWPSPRSFATVEVDGEPVRVKIGPERVKAEFDDVAEAARRLDRPALEVAALAEAAWLAGRGPIGGAALSDPGDGPAPSSA